MKKQMPAIFILCQIIAFFVGCSNPDSPAPPPTPTDSTITITSGGTYTGNWESTDPAVAAVTIATTSAVIISNSNIKSKGIGINVPTAGADLTVINSNGYGINPGVSGNYLGRFINASQPKNLVIEHNYIEHTGGIYVWRFSGDGSSGQTIKIRFNSFKNIDGRASTGSGFSNTDVYRYQAIQFDTVKGLANVEIAWNQIINEPYNSAVEDNISMFNASGTSANKIRIHDNYIKGAYPPDPVNDASYTGGGIMCGDSSKGSDEADSPAYLDVYSNQVVATTNYGIAIAAGKNISFHHNRTIASGYLSDGSWIKTQNIGMYIWNYNNESFFSNNNAWNNVSGWNGPGGHPNDYWFPDAGSLTKNNTSVAPTTALENAEFSDWLTKLSINSFYVGPK
ncbi:MAG: hypothetical protein MUP71_14865 [Candidatus Aminicenantes bacterium]|nr:hypothetical protein [Candidatus Aminicenantes bacterium]